MTVKRRLQFFSIAMIAILLFVGNGLFYVGKGTLLTAAPTKDGKPTWTD